MPHPAGWRNWLRFWFRPRPTHFSKRPAHLPLLAFVEGPHDVEFLRRISRLLHAHRPELPDLGSLEQIGQLIFIPMGGGNLHAWAHRFAALGKAEVHLYDRESLPDSASRRQLTVQVNRRRGCRAFVTAKRTLENYLHPDTLAESRGVQITFGDDELVADLAAQALFDTAAHDVPWDQLPPRSRKRLRNRAKQWLNTDAVERMTLSRLRARDSDGEVISWLAAIAELIAGAP